MRSLLCVLLLLSVALAQETPTKTAAVEVIVTFDGPPPETKPLVLTKELTRFSEEAGRYCGQCAKENKLLDERLIVAKKGGIRDVAVSLPKVVPEENPLPAGTLVNEHCRFSPRVQFVPIGQVLSISNKDPFMHNSRFRPLNGVEVWNGMVAPEKVVKGPRFLRSGLYEITCDAHPWMKGFAIATKTPHCGVTDALGRVLLTGIDAEGPSLLAIWHETLGTHRVNVNLKRGATERIRLSQKDFRTK